ncbi:MAG: hypothetical protein RQ750_13895 [Roseovarius sp.]|nr:hypothetical protein [Roseovarius sp.]
MILFSRLAERLRSIAAKPARRAASDRPPQVSDTFNRAAFFAALRGDNLRHTKESQVTGTESVLDAMKGMPTSWVAYALATAWHETGGKMVPVTESLNYSVAGLLSTFGRHRIRRNDAEFLGRKDGEGPLSLSRQRAIANIVYGGKWGADKLGNVLPDDGWTYRGRGKVQITGRVNYSRAQEATGEPLIEKPELALRDDLSSCIMVAGMTEGWFAGDKAGRHNLARHLPDAVATGAQFIGARRIINGQDRASNIASLALLFQDALIAGGRNEKAA